MTEPILTTDATLHQAIEIIEKTRRFIAVVVGDNDELLSVISDGDIRRAILAGLKLDAPAQDAMVRTPITANADLSHEELKHFLLQNSIAAVPVVDGQGHFVRVVQIEDVNPDEATDNIASGFDAAVIMAGGEGMRLRPMTENLPKPMIPIGGVPLLERQVRSLSKAGIKRIYISTNYLGHLIEEHFTDGSEFGVQIEYLREETKLGTGGALSLLPRLPSGPILVMNGDVMTTSDFGKILAFHNEHDAFITIGSIEYHIEVPFGVININDTRAVGLEEKPSQRFLCNAGIYAIDPKALAQVPKNTRFDMTELIEDAIGNDQMVTVFPIHEYWTDIGSPSDLEQARKKFEEA